MLPVAVPLEFPVMEGMFVADELELEGERVEPVGEPCELGAEELPVPEPEDPDAPPAPDEPEGVELGVADGDELEL